MPYSLGMSIDGGCTGNGAADAQAASAIIIHWRGHKASIQRAPLPSPPIATSQRAELYALVMALEAAIDRKQKLANNPFFQLFIKTDSKYVTGVMNDWRDKWEQNGWKTSEGVAVANQDLIQQAGELEGKIQAKGFVAVNWVPRNQNRHADWAVKKELKGLS